MSRQRAGAGEVTSVISAGIERSLRPMAAVEPGAVAAARSSLLEILAWFQPDEHTNGDEVGSRLGRTGVPLEFGFAPNTNEIRYTAEVADPTEPAEQRFETALKVAALLGAGPPDLDLVEQIRDMQKNAADLTYGAWLSGRHRPSETQGTMGVETRYKLYLEVPSARAQRSDLTATLLGAESIFDDRLPSLCMIGIDLARLDTTPSANPTRVELYYSLPWLHRSDVTTLGARAGMADRVPEVLELIRQACSTALASMPTPYDWGFSYSVQISPTSTKYEAFTLYSYANGLFGGDAKIRRALLKLGDSQGWDLTLYEAATRQLTDRRGFLTCHGMFGITATADPNRAVTATWGSAPPALLPEALS